MRLQHRSDNNACPRPTARAISGSLQDHCWERNDLDVDITDYEVAGFVTADVGFVLLLPNGSEFGVTVTELTR